jgi:hypothetical protein
VNPVEIRWRKFGNDFSGSLTQPVIGRLHRMTTVAVAVWMILAV